MVSHRRIVQKTGPDYYPTPDWGTQVLIDHEIFEGSILEPACGKGDMARVLAKTGCPVVSSDLYDRGFGRSNIDFLTTTRYDQKVGNVVTNPPFNLAEEFLSKALSVATHKICLLLRTAFVEGSGRYTRIFSQRPPTRVWVFSQRLTMYPDGQAVTGSGTTSYSWFVWDLKNPSSETIVKWFPPIYKPGSKIKKTLTSDLSKTVFRFSEAFYRR